MISHILFNTTSFCDTSRKTEKSEDKKGSFFAIPAAVYTSDIGLGLGAGVIKTYYTSGEKVSNLQAFGIYTTKHQFTSSVVWSHFFRKDLYRFYVKAGYDLFPGSFYGVGNNTDNSDPDEFTPEKTELKLFLERRVYRDLKIRTGFLLRNQSLHEHESGSLLLSPDVPWNNGRFDAGPNIGIVWDSRDNTMASNTGMYINLSYYGIFLQNEGNAYNKLEFDCRSFNKVSDNIVLASQVNFEETAGDVPYYLFPNLGSQDALRGYELYRYRDKSMIVLQQDLRFPVFGPLGGCIFVGTGRVADESDKLFSGRWHFSGGTGIRYFVNRKDNLVLRADFAWGADSSRFYVTFSEAF